MDCIHGCGLKSMCCAPYLLYMEHCVLCGVAAKCGSPATAGLCVLGLKGVWPLCARLHRRVTTRSMHCFNVIKAELLPRLYYCARAAREYSSKAMLLCAGILVTAGWGVCGIASCIGTAGLYTTHAVEHVNSAVLTCSYSFATWQCFFNHLLCML